MPTWNRDGDSVEKGNLVVRPKSWRRYVYKAAKLTILSCTASFVNYRYPVSVF